jgi:hypothetical protein
MNAKVLVQLHRESLLCGYCFHSGELVRVTEVTPDPDLARPVVARAVAVRSGKEHEIMEHDQLAIAHPSYTRLNTWET